jgi:hypothetical protein
MPEEKELIAARSIFEIIICKQGAQGTLFSLDGSIPVASVSGWLCKK